MNFTMHIPYGGGFDVRVERIYHSDFKDRYKITGQTRLIVFETNWPLLRGKESGEAPTWKQVEGEPLSESMRDMVLLWLERGVRKEFEKG